MRCEKDKVPCTWATAEEIAALAGLTYAKCTSIIRGCGIEKLGRVKRDGVTGPALFDISEVMRAIASIAEAKKTANDGWAPPLSARMRAFVDASRGYSGCPSLKIPCMMARNCTVGFADEEACNPQNCAEFCANRHAPKGKVNCRACEKYLTARCEFDCLRAAARKKIRIAFGDSQRSMAIPKEVYHA